MSVEPIEENAATPERSRWQFSLRRMFVATTAVAVSFSLAAWGGWIKSDAVVYLSIVVLAGVFSSFARRAIFGACVILGEFWLSAILGSSFFDIPPGRSSFPGPQLFWIIFACLLAISATILRLYTRATAISLVASLLLAEIFTAAVVIYFYGLPTLFQALAAENRRYVFVHFRGNFPMVEQLFIVVPWLLGIALGEFVARRRKSGRGQS